MNPLIEWKGWTLRWSSAHYYRRESWSEEQNKRVFGLCSNTHGHGHDYRLDALFATEGTDFVRVKATLGRLREKLDHQNLNTLSEFKSDIPTTENLLTFIAHFFDQELGPIPYQLKLWENECIWAEYRKN